MNKENRVLFIHNTAVDYRIPFFKMLSDRLNVKYGFTKMYLNEKVYGNKNENKKLKCLNYEIIKNKFNIAVGLINLMKKEDFDIVVMPTMDGVFECLDAIIVFIIAKIKKKKIIYFWEKWDAPDNYLSLKYKLKNFIKRISVKPILCNIDLCIAPGKKTFEYFLKLGVKEKKIFLASDASEVENSENHIDIKRKYKIDKEKKIILYYGRIIKRKGLDYLIKSFYDLKKESINAHLLICGDGEFKNECMDLARNLETTYITFVGRVDPEDREIYFSQCDIFVLPSYFYNGQIEAWGLTVNEAMQFGKPVIATNAVGAGFDMIINNTNGFMIEQESKEQLYKALKQIITDDELYNKMCFESKRMFNEKYNYTYMTEKFVQAIKLINE
jgi:glycosyltransferase involved in cell wall biosynthesis